MRGATTVGVVAIVAMIAACENRTAEDAAEAGSERVAAAAPRGEAQDVLARVDGMVVGAEEFQRSAQRRMGTRTDALSLEAKQEVLEQLVNQKLLYKAALSRGLDKDPQVQRSMIGLFYQREIAAKIPSAFSDEVLQKYYAENKQEFVVPEGVRIKRILIRVREDRPEDEAKAKAEELRNQLVANPESFQELAAEHSEDPNLPAGHASHFLAREEQVWPDRAVVENAFELEVGQLSPVFRSAEGYNIIEVAERREREQRAFEVAKPWVLQKLRSDMLRARYESYVQELRKDASIEVNDQALGSIEVTPLRRGQPPPNVPPPREPAAAEPGD